MGYYPRADFEPGLTELAKLLWPDDWMMNKRRLLLGNGASELIDLIARCGSQMGGWKPGLLLLLFIEASSRCCCCSLSLLNFSFKESLAMRVCRGQLAFNPPHLLTFGNRVLFHMSLHMTSKRQHVRGPKYSYSVGSV